MYEWKWIHSQPFLYFRRSDYFRPEVPSLYHAVEKAYEEQTGKKWEGQIYLLTQLCSFGFGFNPVSFYFGFQTSQEQPDFILSEITNTPWNERQAYWSFPSTTPDKDPQPSCRIKSEFLKKFHVSPFLGMDYQYKWTFSVQRKEQNESILIHMENLNLETHQKDFDATLTLKLQPAHFGTWLKSLLFSPFMTFRSVFLIYVHAMILFLRKVPFLAHPKYTK